MKKIKHGLKDFLLNLIPRKLKDWLKDLYGFDTQYCLRRLKERKGFYPDCIIDCGAYVGEWAIMANRIFPKAKILMLEANPKKEESLRKLKNSFVSKLDYKICLLGAKQQEEVPFFSLETGSSVLKENTNFPSEILRLAMTTLDQEAKDFCASKSTLLKLDLQGYELEALKGASEVLKNAEVVLMEVSFLPFNQGAALFDQAVEFMSDRGFLVYDLGSQIRWHKDGTLVQADVFFVQKDSRLRAVNFEEVKSR